jgi:hypothetical protein
MLHVLHLHKCEYCLSVTAMTMAMIYGTLHATVRTLAQSRESAVIQ